MRNKVLETIVVLLLFTILLIALLGQCQEARSETARKRSVLLSRHEQQIHYFNACREIDANPNLSLEQKAVMRAQIHKQMYPKKKYPDWVGKIVYLMLGILCFLVFKRIQPQEWRSLWKK